MLERVEGPTLADRIEHGPLDITDAVDVARQIAETVENAHTAGLVHRDPKPANIKLTPDGRVKVLDFGLANLVDDTTAHASMSMSPTLIVQE